MPKLIPEYSVLSLKLEQDKRIIIDNFRELKDLSESLIVIDQYMITGSFLKITKMDNTALEIYGKIKEIIVV